MIFSEAVTELKNGKKIRRFSWQDNLYLQLDDEHNVKCYHLNILYFPFNESIILSNDWIVLDSLTTEIMDIPFHEMLICISKGMKAKLPTWKNEWIELDKPTKQLIIKSWFEIKGNLVYEDFIADDWQIKE